jgi:hypothetical protein
MIHSKGSLTHPVLQILVLSSIADRQCEDQDGMRSWAQLLNLNSKESCNMILGIQVPAFQSQR